MALPYGVILLTITLGMVLIFKTDIIKDTSVTPTGKPYSLARTQLMCWTLIIFCCFIYIWGFSKDINKVELGKTTLILLGISTGIVMVGKSIDDSDKQELEKGNIKSLIQDSPSGGFLWDILTDRKGISIHRLQNVLFTVALMIGFIVSVYYSSKMPEFDETLLILSGVSSAGYLGVKLNENK